MTLKLRRTDVPETFEKDVDAYREALLAHRFTLNEPAPVAPNELVHNAVKRVQHPIADKKPDDFVIDYVLLEDSFEEKKHRLAEHVLQAERILSNKILPQAKVRLWGHREKDIHDAALASKIAFQQKNNEEAATVKDDPEKVKEILEREWVDTVPSEDQAFMKAHKERLKRLDELHRSVAQALSDIDDLTPQSIGSWQVPDALCEVSAPAETQKGV